MSALTEGRHPAEFTVSEAAGRRSRDPVTIAAGIISASQILGLVLAAQVGAGSNTGTGALAMHATPFDAYIQSGVYAVRCIATATNGGAFRVTDPRGNVLGDATVGVLFSNQVRFTLADATVDFQVGDSFTITVAAGGFAGLNLAAVNGTAIARAIAWGNYDATGGPVPGVAMVRDCEIAEPQIAWPSGISDGQKATAIAQLAQHGIIVRAGSPESVIPG